MSNRRNTLPLLVSLFLFILLFIFTYPFYRYYIDPDAVAYLTIAKRYAAHDYLRAVNGLWSPFSSWLVATCIRCGMDMLKAAQFINGIACICIIGASFTLFRRFNINGIVLNSLMICLPVFLIFCHYIQLFADLWQVFFLLCYLLLVTSPSFIHNKTNWVLCGIIGALAYYAKAYSFYFILIHLIVSLLILTKQNGLNKKTIIKPFAAIILVMLIIMSPWLYALHKKYNIWTLSTASVLNESWYLTGHKTPKPGVDYLFPPPYSNSPCNWEDPYINEGHLYKPWESSDLIVAQTKRAAFATWQTFIALLQISIFLLLVLLYTAWNILFKKSHLINNRPSPFNTNHKILLLASLIMPVGYMSLHMEARYIWLLAFTGMVFGALWLNNLKDKNYFKTAALAFAFSFIIYPTYEMRKLYRAGETTYTQAMELKQIGFTGSFTSNIKPNQPEVIALLTGMQYYEPVFAIWSPGVLDHKRLLVDIRKYHINYYFLYTDISNALLVDENGNEFPLIYNTPQLKIFKITPLHI